ncbi:MAG: tRNA (adenosine(37)-N6)-threonylcarbamoyltransferase complex dimerization subunit type 1 TsaB [Candidatus Kapaibacterium sp.]
MKINRILAIESSGINSGIAIGTINELIYETSLYLRHSHDETLAYQIKQTLEFLNLEISDIDAVAVSSGPGSFTGLRVGSAIAKGITFGEVPKLIDVPTMNSFAFAASEFANILDVKSIFVIIPSNKDYYFVSEHNKSGNLIKEPILYSKEDVQKMNLDLNVVCGTGANDFKGNNYQLSELNRLTPRFILKFAQLKYVEKEFVKSELFKPQYFQDFKPTQKKVDK